MIEQQLYTRSSKGLFLGSQGYDTVRKSDGLSVDDAKSNHSYCSYEGNNIPGLFESPQIIKRQIKPDGDIVLIGSNPYQYMDKDGIRNAHISHAYVMRAGSPELETQAHDIRQLAGVTDFIDFHIDGSNDPLEQLRELPYSTKYSEIDYVKSTIARLPKEFLAQIVLAAILSAYNGKKVFIVPEGIDETFSIMNLIRTIYYCMPYSLRNKIGYTSLLNGNLPSGISLAFVPEAYLDSVKSGNVFKNYVNADYCIGMLEQKVYYDGEGTLVAEPEILEMLVDFLDCDEDYAVIPRKLTFIENTLNGSELTKERLVEFAKFFNNLSNGEESVVNCISVYKSFPTQYNTQYAAVNVFATIDNFCTETQGKLTPNSVKAISGLYDSEPDDRKETVYNIVKASLMLCTENEIDFFDRLDASSESPVLRSRLVDSVLENDLATKLYYGNVFCNVHNTEELCRRVSGYTNSEIQNVSFISTFNAKVEELYKANPTISFIKQLYDDLALIRNPQFSIAAEETLTRLVTSFTETVSPYTLSLEEAKQLSHSLKSFCQNKSFLNRVKEIDRVFNLSAAFQVEEYASYVRLVNQYDDGRLIEYIKRYFENSQELDTNCFFALTCAYYEDSDYINFRELYSNFKSLDMVKKYTMWLIRVFYYLSIYNDLRALDGSTEVGHKYADVANAVLRATATVQEEIGSKEAGEYCEDMTQYIIPGDDIYDDVAKEFEKGLKRALKGKDFPILTSVDPNQSFLEDFDAGDDNGSDKKSFKNLFRKK